MRDPNKTVEFYDMKKDAGRNFWAEVQKLANGDIDCLIVGFKEASGKAEMKLWEVEALWLRDFLIELLPVNAVTQAVWERETEFLKGLRKQFLNFQSVAEQLLFLTSEEAGKALCEQEIKDLLKERAHDLADLVFKIKDKE